MAEGALVPLGSFFQEVSVVRMSRIAKWASPETVVPFHRTYFGQVHQSTVLETGDMGHPLEPEMPVFGGREVSDQGGVMYDAAWLLVGVC